MTDITSDPFPGPVGPLDAPAQTQARTFALPIQFTGSGSEYFRIWIVNLLLIIVTLGIYFPWAKVRRLRYFHGNTLVDGHAMDFHGSPIKMLKGYLLVGLLFGLYSVAGQFSPVAGLVAFMIVAAIWPALLKSSMQFRLANTSWRGMRFAFKGSLADAYRAILPIFAPGVFILAANIGIADPEQGVEPSMLWVSLSLGASLISIAVAPWLFWNFKRYQHDHYALASLQTTFVATRGSFYKLGFKAMALLLLPMFLFGMVVAIALPAAQGGGGAGAMMVILSVLGFLTFLLVFVAALPYITSRLQNLVWNGTSNRTIRFLSDLRFMPLLWLTLKNWVLIVITLGLYWPFAAIATARMRLQAVQAEMREDPQELINRTQSHEGDAAGEAGGDLFGFDIGL